MDEGKKFSLSFKIDCAKELILERVRTLTIISSIAFAVIGIIISSDSDFVKSKIFAYLSFFTLIILALFSLGYYIFSIRSDIKSMCNEILKLPQEDWSQSLDREKYDPGYLPELLYILLCLSIVSFLFSLF